MFGLLTAITASRTERERHSLGGREVSLVVVVIVSVTTDEKEENDQSVHTEQLKFDSSVSFKRHRVNPSSQVLTRVLSDWHGEDFYTPTAELM